MKNGPSKIYLEIRDKYVAGNLTIEFSKSACSKGAETDGSTALRQELKPVQTSFIVVGLDPSDMIALVGKDRK
jgi:hypothetical protein